MSWNTNRMLTNVRCSRFPNVKCENPLSRSTHFNVLISLLQQNPHTYTISRCYYLGKSGIFRDWKFFFTAWNFSFLPLKIRNLNFIGGNLWNFTFKFKFFFF